MELFESGGRPVKNAVMRCCVVTVWRAGIVNVMFGAEEILGTGGIGSGILAFVGLGLLLCWGVASIRFTFLAGFLRWVGVGRRALGEAGLS